MSRINSNKTTILLLLCFMAPLVLLFACTQNADVVEEKTSKGIEEAKPPTKIDRRIIEERAQISKFSDHVRRDGDTLYLKTESGADLTFKDTQGCVYPSACDYEFVDYYSDLGFYLIFAGYYEGEEYIMISDKDGKEYSVKELPRFSPDKERIVSVSSCEEYCNNGVFIWHIIGGGLVPELFYEPEEYVRYSFIKWKDDRSIELTKKISSKEQLCSKSDSMIVAVTLQLEEGSWRFYDDLNRENIRCGPDRTGSTIPS